MLNAAFVVWRESVEALLVVGILYSWLRQQQAVGALRWLWGGVVAGLGLAGLLAWAMFSSSLWLQEGWLQEQGLELFQAGMVLLASVLVLQMVLWLRRHGRGLHRHLQNSAEQALTTANYLGLASLAGLAVAREGAETAVFLYGIAQAPESGAGDLLLAGGGGLLAAFMTFWLLQRSRRWLSWPLFFKVSEGMLLCLGGALLVAGLERLIGLEYLPALMDPVWDSRLWLDDSHGPGAVLAGLVGYRAQPAGSLLLGLLLYWGLTLWLLRSTRSAA